MFEGITRACAIFHLSVVTFTSSVPKMGPSCP